MTGDVTYTCAFHDLPNGLQTHCYAPAGLNIRDRWTIHGSLPGEPPQPVELGAPRTGLYLQEDVDMRCNIVMAGFVRKTLQKSHAALVDRLKIKALLVTASEKVESASLSSLGSSTGSYGSLVDGRVGGSVGSTDSLGSSICKTNSKTNRSLDTTASSPKARPWTIWMTAARTSAPPASRPANAAPSQMPQAGVPYYQCQSASNSVPGIKNTNSTSSLAPVHSDLYPGQRRYSFLPGRREARPDRQAPQPQPYQQQQKQPQQQQGQQYPQKQHQYQNQHHRNQQGEQNQRPVKYVVPTVHRPQQTGPGRSQPVHTATVVSPNNVVINLTQVPDPRRLHRFSAVRTDMGPVSWNTFQRLGPKQQPPTTGLQQQNVRPSKPYHVSPPASVPRKPLPPIARPHPPVQTSVPKIGITPASAQSTTLVLTAPLQQHPEYPHMSAYSEDPRANPLLGQGLLPPGHMKARSCLDLRESQVAATLRGPWAAEIM
jgi:hypothetical protein